MKTKSIITIILAFALCALIVIFAIKTFEKSTPDESDGNKVEEESPATNDDGKDVTLDESNEDNAEEESTTSNDDGEDVTFDESDEDNTEEESTTSNDDGEDVTFDESDEDNTEEESTTNDNREEDAPDEYDISLIYSEFSEDKVAEVSLTTNDDWKALASYSSVWSEWETPELFMLDCKLTTYYRNVTASIPTGAILYAVGHGSPRIGTESDTSIIEDFLNDGYIVIVTEFLDSAKAVYPAIDGAATILSYEVSKNAKFVGDYYHDYLVYDTFVIPAGYRLKRNIPFFDVTQHSAKGTLDFIVSVWNDADTKPVVESNGITWKSATSLDDIIMPNGKAINDVESGNYDKFLKYKMDIIYPSMPKEDIEIPVFAMGSGSFVRTQAGSSGHLERMHTVGFLFRGYATAVYDHEYISYMNGRDSYMHVPNTNYTITPYTAAKYHSAAMRCIRAYAEEFGYSKDKIGVGGHSKSSIVGLLSSPNPQLLSEHRVYSGFVQGETYGEQPYLTYSDGTPIPSNATCVYHSMGYGTINRGLYLSPENSPTFIACGVLDNASPAPRDYWEQEYIDYSTTGIPFAAAYMPNVGHTLPYYVIDPIYGYNYYEFFCAFFDYYLKDASPIVAYTGIEVDGKVDIDDKGLFIYFSAPITEWSLIKNVSVTDSNGNVVSGEWIGDCGGLKWNFVSNELVRNQTYTLRIETGTSDINGNSLDSTYESIFTIK